MVKLNADQPAHISQQYLLIEPLLSNKQGLFAATPLRTANWHVAPFENGEGRNQGGKHGMKESSSWNETGSVRQAIKRVRTSHQLTAGKQSFATPTG